MPFELSKFQLPCGLPCGRIVWSGVTTAEEAGVVLKAVAPGGQIEGLPVLVLAQKMEAMTPDARRVFGSGAERGWLAIVVTNPLVRVTTNFIMRFSRSSKARMFGTEEAAIQWLDARVREDAARTKPASP